MGLSTCAYELCIGPPEEHLAAGLCQRLLALSGIGSTHWLGLRTGQVWQPSLKPKDVPLLACKAW